MERATASVIRIDRRDPLLLLRPVTTSSTSIDEEEAPPSPRKGVGAWGAREASRLLARDRGGGIGPPILGEVFPCC